LLLFKELLRFLFFADFYNPFLPSKDEEEGDKSSTLIWFISDCSLYGLRSASDFELWDRSLSLSTTLEGIFLYFCRLFFESEAYLFFEK
jgi:hypothetical protein